MSDAADKDLYSILGASPSDSLQQLKQKYQRLALLYHPDRLGPGVCTAEAETGLQKFLEADAAWRTLSDRDARRQYDLQRRARQLKQDWPVEATVCLEDMTWDQDNGVYTYDCRCGGEFSISKEELEEELEEEREEEEEEEALKQEEEAKEEEKERKRREEESEEEGAILCCDTCSLSIEVSMSR